MEKEPNYGRLKLMLITALNAGIGMFILSMVLMGQFQQLELAPVVMSVAFGAITFSGLFYFGALLLEGSLQKYIVSDDTVIRGEAVEMVTTTEETDDDRLNGWIRTYAFARNLFGMSVIPLLILAGLWVFA